MEFSESVLINDPITGRQCTVLLSTNEVHMLLNIGINTLLAQGLISLMHQEDGTTKVDTGDSTLQ